MSRYLCIPILCIASALAASLLPQAVRFVLTVLSGILPIFTNTRGQISLVMLLVMCWAVHASLSEGFVWAVVGGIAIDLLSILPLGTSAFALVLIVFAVNTAASQLYRVRIPLLLAMAGLATVLMQLITHQALVLLGNAYDVAALIQLVLLPTLLYNLVAVLPVYGLVRLLQKRLAAGQPARLSASEVTA